MQRHGSLLISIALIAVCWFFWYSPFLFPVRIFVVLLHELGHASMALLTGGEVLRIELSMDEGGLALTRGGSRFLTLNAGYLGSLVFGALMLAASRSPRLVGPVLGLIALVTAVTTALYLRPIFSFAFAYGLAAAAALTLMSTRGPEGLQAFVLRFLGLFSCLYALVDIRDDILSFRRSGSISDATMLADLTLIPAFVWGLGWLGLSVLVLFFLRRRLFW